MDDKILEPTRLHQGLGVITLAVFIAVTGLDMLPGYEASPTISAMLFLAFMTFLGFGQLVGRLADVYE